MPLKLSAALPKGDRNGLEAVFDDVLKHGNREQMIVASITCSQVVSSPRSDTVSATLRIEAIEAFPCGDPRWHDARELLERQREGRTGKVRLPLDE